MRRLVIDWCPDVVMGDMNVDVSNSNWLTTLFQSLNYEQKVHAPTTDGFTTIDSVFIRQHLPHEAYVLESPVSYHKPILTLL